MIAEYLDHQHRLPSLFGLNFPADDIPPHARQLFREARVRNVVDVELGVIGQSRLCDPDTGEILAEDWVYRPLDPCHMEYLTAMGVRSSVVAPIFDHDEMWGLLVGHHADRKELAMEQLQAVQLVVEQLSVAIAQSNLLTAAQEKADREATLSRIATLLHSLTTIELQQALEETVAAFHGSGGRLYISNAITQADAAPLKESPLQVYTCGQQPVMPEHTMLQAMEQSFGIQDYFGHRIPQGDYRPWAIEDVYQIGDLRNLQPLLRPTAIRSLLIVPLMARQQRVGYLSIFRDEFVAETLWAGEFHPDSRQTYPRQSFEIWKHSQTGRVTPWTDIDCDMATAIAQQFATALEQHELYRQIQTFNANLEQQVEQRTAELQQALVNLQRTQSQLIQAEKMSGLGQLVAGVAHEINNPVNFIHGNLNHVCGYTQDLLKFIQLYQQHYPPLPPEIQDQVNDLDLDFIRHDLPQTVASMQAGTERIRQLVLSLRNFSRLDEAEMKPVDIHEGIESTLLLLQHRLKANGDRPPITIIKEYGTLPLVECYAGQLNQVFMNILSNAIDVLEEENRHCPLSERSGKSGQIRIETAPKDDQHITIRISDNGKGMTAAVQRCIFNPFFTTKPVGQGTGLGLSLVYHIIVEKHQGTLDCESQPGQGTEFAIAIPQQWVPR
ncbi:MAG: ATP-binding protein [Oculatellaceae cyanobacterium Prado106]|nr:ATP-binding protein [Oculatellaceae cyanobacterium Prado106]